MGKHFKEHLDNAFSIFSLVLGCSVKNGELSLMILMSSFQLKIFYDFVIFFFKILNPFLFVKFPTKFKDQI